MSSAFSSQQVTHKLFLILPLSMPVLLTPHNSITKHKSSCDYFKRGEHLTKGTSQYDTQALFNDADARKFDKNMLYKKKLTCILNIYGMNHSAHKTRTRQATMYHFEIELCSCVFESNKRR